MAQSPAQKAAFQKMIAGRKAKSASPTVKAPKGKSGAVGVLAKKKNSNLPFTPNAKKSAARIKTNLSEKSKARTQVGFD